MSGNEIPNIVFDTNAVIYFLEGDVRLTEYKYSTIYISEFTEIELKGRFGISPEELEHLGIILHDFIILPFNNEIKERAISIRHENKLKLPDALILATAIWIDLPFLTADKHFKNIDNINLIMI